MGNNSKATREKEAGGGEVPEINDCGPSVSDAPPTPPPGPALCGCKGLSAWDDPQMKATMFPKHLPDKLLLVGAGTIFIL